MKQVYYTQCPLGYGLGATNGFQVKRLDEGYPTGVDFRHLGMRAFLPGSRILAPSSLRYRRDGEVAEVAWLTPRTHEYETEAGRLWGRPGGQFAHGLRLEETELEEIAFWPAGLFEGAFWRRSDQERTAGRPPEPLRLSAQDLIRRPTLEAVSELAADLTMEKLAQLLAGVARAAAESRCLFLVAKREKLGPLVALLTFCFPAPLRAELSFSTYHDRPEELTGFRMQGTVPEARPNRLILNSQGVVADLETGVIDLVAQVPEWARTLAGWVIDGKGESADAWNRTGQRLRGMKRLPETAERWSDEWLGHLIGFETRTRGELVFPVSEQDWAEELSLAKWSARMGMAGEWLAARNPEWWRQAMGRAVQAERCPGSDAVVFSSRLALAAQRSGGDWIAKIGSASEWGRMIGEWQSRASADEVATTTTDLLRATPEELRGAFLAALTHRLPFALGEQVIDRLGASPVFEPELLLPIEASRLAASLRQEGHLERLKEVLQQMMATPGAVVSTLEAVAAAVSEREEDRALIAELLAVQFEAGDQPGWEAAWRWGVSRQSSEGWLGPFVRRVVEEAPEDRSRWRHLLEQTPERLRARFVRSWLDHLEYESLAHQAAVAWGVEDVLIPMGAAVGTSAQGWAEKYVGSRSGLDLSRRLYQRETRDRMTGRWLSEAHRRGELGAGSLERLRASRQFAEALALRNLESLADLVLPEVPAAQRGAVLSDMLGAFGGGLSEGLLPCLGVCVRNWKVEAFSSGAEGMEGIACTLAEALRGEVARPEWWVRALLVVVDHLGLDEAQRTDVLGPTGLAAHVLRESLREEAGLTEQKSRELRMAVFRDLAAWKALGMEVAGGLDGVRKKEIERDLAFWDHELVRGSKELEQRFAELLLNSSPTPLAMVTAVEYHANHLTRLEPVAWWVVGEKAAGPTDFRERFATWAPMAPLENSALFSIRGWMRRGGEGGVPEFDPEDLEVLPEDRTLRTLEAVNTRRPAWVSERGWARWKCLEALTVMGRPGLGEMERWNTVGTWAIEGLPLGILEEEDRYAFVARVIWHLQEYDPGDLNQQRFVQKLAKWLVGQGIDQSGRIRAWTRDLQAENEGDRMTSQRKELVRDLCRELDEERVRK